MESTSTLNLIKVSQSTADELIQHKKGHWLMSEDPVEVKGKGPMQTYWVNSKGGSGSVASARIDAESSMPSSLGDKTERLVDWNADVLGSLSDKSCCVEEAEAPSRISAAGKKDGIMVLDKVKEIIDLPEFDPTTITSRHHWSRPSTTIPLESPQTH